MSYRTNRKTGGKFRVPNITQIPKVGDKDIVEQIFTIKDKDGLSRAKIKARELGFYPQISEVSGGVKVTRIHTQASVNNYTNYPEFFEPYWGGKP